MDTPESEVSAIQAGTMEPLPLYVEDEGALSRTQILIANLSLSLIPYGHEVDPATLYSFVEAQSSPPSIEIDPKSATPLASLPEPIMEYPARFSGTQSVDLTRVKQAIVTGLFNAIRDGNGEAVTLLIMNRLVSANTTNHCGMTPLLAAISARDVQIVKLLISLGADPHAYGTTTVWASSSHRGLSSSSATRRTPLQLAASLGHLPLVKLLFETHHCDDAAVAPDGQIALRLAAANGHRDVVAYLPTRRGGGFKRWQVAHAKAIGRAKYAARKIARFGKFFLWDVEKFLVWTAPKHAIVLPVKRFCQWCWARRGLVGPWCAHQASALPGRIRRALAEIWRVVIKEIPRAVWRFFAEEVPRLTRELAIQIWEALTVHLPNITAEVAKWLWRALTVRIPNAIAIAAKWLWDGVTAAGRAVSDVLLSVVSLMHTLLAAIATFFRGLTLSDVYNGFVGVLHALFVAVPKTLWSWICDFVEVSYKIMVAGLGTTGMVLWWLVVAIGWLVTYVPGKLWVILSSMGDSIANAWWEVLVFFRPKA